MDPQGLAAPSPLRPPCLLRPRRSPRRPGCPPIKEAAGCPRLGGSNRPNTNEREPTKPQISPHVKTYPARGGSTQTCGAGLLAHRAAGLATEDAGVSANGESSPLFVRSDVDDYPWTPQEFRVLGAVARRGTFFESIPKFSQRVQMHRNTL